jgi:uncharacterized DUF497 family protein
MRIEYDPAKREKTLAERGLDFLDAPEVIATSLKSVPDRRADYGEPRTNTFGLLGSRVVHVTWTVRDGVLRVISMRYANDRERAALRR